MAEEIKPKSLDICVIDDQPTILKTMKTTIGNFLDHDNPKDHDFKSILGDNSEVTASYASCTAEAEEIYHQQLLSSPNIYKIFISDWRMPQETGGQFAQRIRDTYLFQKVAFGIFTGFLGEDLTEESARKSGSYMALSKPVSVDTLKLKLVDMMNVLIIKTKPEKKPLTETFVFHTISTPEQLKEYLKLRYTVYGLLNYIEPQYLSKTNMLEIERYDKTSIPIGGFLLDNDGTEHLVATVKIITPKEQEPFKIWTDKIVDDVKDSIIAASYDRKIVQPFPCYGTFPDQIEKQLQLIKARNEQYFEYSRFIVNPHYRGLNLGATIVAYIEALSYSMNVNNIFIDCAPFHAETNMKYGFRKVEGTDITIAEGYEIKVNTMQTNLKDSAMMAPEHKQLVHDVFLPAIQKGKNYVFVNPLPQETELQHSKSIDRIMAHIAN